MGEILQHFINKAKEASENFDLEQLQEAHACLEKCQASIKDKEFQISDEGKNSNYATGIDYDVETGEVTLKGRNAYHEVRTAKYNAKTGVIIRFDGSKIDITNGTTTDQNGVVTRLPEKANTLDILFSRKLIGYVEKLLLVKSSEIANTFCLEGCAKPPSVMDVVATHTAKRKEEEQNRLYKTSRYPDDFYLTFGFKEKESFIETSSELAKMLREDADHNLYFEVPNKGRLDIGILETPSVAELKIKVQHQFEQLNTSQKTKLNSGATADRSVLCNTVGDADKMHRNVDNAGKTFQSASQFNILEMINPSATPEDGISCYAMDRTQGPACTRSTYAALAFRNFFANCETSCNKLAASTIGNGQTRDHQLNLLHDSLTIASAGKKLVRVTNGYTESTDDELKKLNSWMQNPKNAELFRNNLRIGTQTNVGVIGHDGKQSHTVNQTFNSAVAIGYSKTVKDKSLWEPLAREVLKATYEATLLSGTLNNIERVQKDLLPLPIELTKVGGGVFQNDPEWIKEAITYAVQSVKSLGIKVDLNIVHFGSVEATYQDWHNVEIKHGSLPFDITNSATDSNLEGKPEGDPVRRPKLRGM